jgi:uncharacterized membrane protein YraQ (UPF0718 family)
MFFKKGIILNEFIFESWEILKESSFYILIGFFFAGIVHYLIPPKSVSKHLGRHKLSSVIKASLFGIPLPLCSCSVIPMAFSLKKSGASRGSVVSFLISTPETGVDSIFITYALMGPVIMIARPIAAFFTATFAGIMELFLGKGEPVAETVADAKESSGCSDSCCGGEKPDERSLKGSLSYAFHDLYKDIYKMFLVGVLIAGAISAMIPGDTLTRFMAPGFISMLIMLLVGVPMYVCATASTPIAAALLMKGLSPGAAIVFLLAGPATNMVTLTVITKNLGRRTTILYLVSIVISSLFFGYMIDFTYDFFGLSTDFTAFTAEELIPDTIKIVSSYALLAFSLYIFLGEKLKKAKSKKNDAV